MGSRADAGSSMRMTSGSTAIARAMQRRCCQQRLCIARAIAVEPDVILMDEPASALDPIATVRIEDLMQELKEYYSIIIVTHNMQQAARVSDKTAFLYTEVDEDTSTRWGILVEFGETGQIFTNPRDRRTEDYVSGRFG